MAEAATKSMAEVATMPDTSAALTVAQIRARTREALKATSQIAVDHVTTVSGLPAGLQPYVVPADCTVERKRLLHEKLTARGWVLWEAPILTSLPARPAVYVMAREDYETQRDARGRRLVQAARGR